MRPVSLRPEDLIEFAKPTRFGAPDGVSDEECATIEGLVIHDFDPVFPHRVAVPVELEDDDLARLTAGERLWLIVYSSVLPPFSIGCDPPTAIGPRVHPSSNGHPAAE